MGSINVVSKVHKGKKMSKLAYGGPFFISENVCICGGLYLLGLGEGVQESGAPADTGKHCQLIHSSHADRLIPTPTPRFTWAVSFTF